MKALSTMKSKLHAFFIFPIDGEYVFRFRLTVTTSNIWGWGGGPLCLSHISHCYIWSFNYCGHGYGNTSTTVKQHSHADLNVWINSLLRSPAQTRVFDFFWCLASWINVNKKVQLDATVCRHLFTAKSLYMFLVSQLPSSWALKTVTATSGIGHNTGTATSFQRGLIRNDQTTLEGSSCTSVMTYTRGSGYGF